MNLKIAFSLQLDQIISNLPPFFNSVIAVIGFLSSCDLEAVASQSDQMRLEKKSPKMYQKPVCDKINT
jgi:hypothetical protein